MKKIYIITLTLIIASLFLAGCVSTFDATAIAKLDSSVQAFLEAHPNAELKAVFISGTTFEEMKDEVSADCEIPMMVKDYYRVKVSDPSTQLKLTLWIDNATQQTLCLIKEGKDIPAPEPTNPVDDTEPTNPVDEIECGNNICETGETTTNCPDDCTTIIEAEPIITIDETEVSFDKINLSSNGTSVYEVTMRYVNTSDTEKTLDYDLTFQLKNSSGNVVTSVAGKRLYLYNSIGTEFETIRLQTDFVPNGSYALELVVYNRGSNVPLKTLSKDINLGPDEPKEILSVKNKYDYTTTSEIIFSDTKVEFDQVNLNSAGNQISEAVLRITDEAETTHLVDKTLKYSILNNQGEIVDSSRNLRLYEYELKGTIFQSDKSFNFTYSLSPGSYVILAELYNAGSNKAPLQLAIPVVFGPDEPKIINTKKATLTYMDKSSTTIAPNINVNVKGIKLINNKTRISEVEFDIENTGGTAAPTFDRYLHFTIVNDQNEILETMNNGRLYEYSLTGATTGKQTNDIGDTYYLSPGDYKLVVGIYNKGSNIPSAFVTKNFTMGPDASLEQ